MTILGIDLGTTNSLGAVYRHNHVELIPTQFGSFLTPSVVSVDGQDILVGEIAKQRLITHPELTAASFKKDMGTDKEYLLGKQVFTPEELSSFVIKSIIRDAQDYLGETIDEVIISVPAYFHDKQRVATKKAGELAGVHVMRLINEPSAASLASYVHEHRENHLLVFDFGGGTLDISIVDCFHTMVEILAVAGDNRLGGDDIDTCMRDSFIYEHMIPEQKLSRQEMALLLREAEKCKRLLTTKDQALMQMNLHGQTYTSTFTNARLLDDCSDIFLKIRKVLTHALKDSHSTPRSIDGIVLAGGSSKMPIIQSYLQHLFPGVPLVEGNGDELIARGLGVVCGIVARHEDVKDMILTDICPFSLGVNTHNRTNPGNDYMTPIIPRNTALPCSRVERFYTTHDGQTRIKACILQGEHPYAKDNLQLGELVINVPGGPEGREAVDIRFTYDINGILIVDMTCVSTQEHQSVVMSEQLSDEERSRRMKQLNKLKIHPKDNAQNKLILEKLETLYVEAGINEKDDIHHLIANFTKLLATQNVIAIDKERQKLEKYIQEKESYDPFAFLDDELTGNGQSWMN